MSGVGKTTLVEYTKNKLVAQGFSVLILDGDVVRKKYKVKLGFGREHVKRNNFYVAQLCAVDRNNYDVIMVPIISPIDSVRRKVKSILSPGYNLVYICADIESLKKRDKKGLYKKSDNGEITGMNHEILKLHKDSFDKFKLRFGQLIDKRIGKEFIDLIDFELIAISPEKHVLEVKCSPIPAGGSGCYLDKLDFYVRRNPHSEILIGKDLVDYCEKRFKK